ncbi:TPA: hypothetical protein KNH78_002114 [Clostridioides difficile]|nr:hypothetical protein [Clostridioides difficile]HCQ5572439.1 hypothetical protein [Clostridioides difficile]
MEERTLIEQLIQKDERIKIYKILHIGKSAFQRFIDESREFANSKSFVPIKTRVLNCLIKRQFESDVLAANFPFGVEFKNINRGKETALFLKKDKVRMNMRKINRKRILCNETKISKYMLAESSVNSKYEKQIKFLLEDEKNIHIGEDKHTFIILGYGIKDNEVVHLDFMIPDENMKYDTSYYNGLEEYKEVINTSVNDENIEKSIVELKEEIKKFVFLD